MLNPNRLICAPAISYIQDTRGRNLALCELGLGRTQDALDHALHAAKIVCEVASSLKTMARVLG
jgi:hypothetical protein